MRLQTMLVKILEDYNISHEKGLNRAEFVEFVVRKKRLRFFREGIWYGREKFKRKINFILGDCIRGEYEYITEDDDRETLVVTPKGRDILTPSGYREESVKRRRRTTDLRYSTNYLRANVVLIIISAAIGYILGKL